MRYPTSDAADDADVWRHTVLSVAIILSSLDGKYETVLSVPVRLYNSPCWMTTFNIVKS